MYSLIDAFYPKKQPGDLADVISIGVAVTLSGLKGNLISVLTTQRHGVKQGFVDCNTFGLFKLLTTLYTMLTV